MMFLSHEWKRKREYSIAKFLQYAIIIVVIPDSLKNCFHNLYPFYLKAF